MSQLAYKKEGWQLLQDWTLWNWKLMWTVWKKLNKFEFCGHCLQFFQKLNTCKYCDNTFEDLVAKVPLVKFPLVLVLKVPWGNM